MRFNVELGSADAKNTPLLAIPFFEKDFGFDADLKKLDQNYGGAISGVIKNKDFLGKNKQSVVLYGNGKTAAKRVLLFGMGDKKGYKSDCLRLAAYHLGKAITAAGQNQCAVYLGHIDVSGVEGAKAASMFCEGFHYANYHYFRRKTKDSKEISAATLLFKDRKNIKGVTEAVKASEIISQAIVTSRDLQNDPANFATPTALANTAKNIGKKYGLKVQVFDKKKMEQLKMGSMLGVARGSNEPPRFIIMEYVPKGVKNAPTICLVGKGLTFDAGGLSIKPADGMMGMKYDMSGGAVVIGTMEALARLKPKAHVYGVVPSTENLLGGSAQKPGDVVKTCDGKTIEVLNTDAEGRLILADALGYIKRFNPDAVIDLATLTGAMVVALGEEIAGYFSNDRALAAKIKKAAESAEEHFWEMPLFEGYRDSLKSKVADQKNISGGRWGGSITAALFLEYFVDYKWAHLDIAGPAAIGSGKGYYQDTGSGFGVRTMVDLVMNW